ncbi:copper transporter 6-like [Coffea arabica]|uniref:Copper transport protein n=1 Tax=Coffea arabica TaxID=13443 RepID=A0A6P6SX48_COFAR|nr:copper transporter 2-like [Coffea arabica]
MDRGDMPMPTPPNSTMSTNDNMTSMQMSFFWGKDVVVLFRGWPDNNLGMYILALFFVFFLGFAVEVLSASPRVLKTTGVFSSLSQAGAYAIRMALAYLVMLSVMSFNLGIFIVAVAGHGVGHFLVNFRKPAAAQTNSLTLDPKV